MARSHFNIRIYRPSSGTRDQYSCRILHIFLPVKCLSDHSCVLSFVYAYSFILQIVFILSAPVSKRQFGADVEVHFFIRMEMNTMKPVLNGTWKKQKPVFTGRFYSSKGPNFKYLCETEPHCNGNNSVPCGSVLGRFQCMLFSINVKSSQLDLFL